MSENEYETTDRGYDKILNLARKLFGENFVEHIPEERTILILSRVRLRMTYSFNETKVYFNFGFLTSKTHKDILEKIKGDDKLNYRFIGETLLKSFRFLDYDTCEHFLVLLSTVNEFIKRYEDWKEV